MKHCPLSGSGQCNRVARVGGFFGRFFVSWCTGCVCVCVHPWTKGFVQPIHLPLVPPPIHKQGRVTLFSYHTQRSCGEEWEGKLGQFPVPATQLLIKPFHFLLFVSWCFMLPPPNSFFSATFSSRAFYSLSPQSRETTIVQTPTISRTFRHAVPPPSFPSW